MSQLWAEFAVSSMLAVLCVVIHGLGLFSLSHALRGETAVERLKQIAPLSPRGVAFTLGIVMAIPGAARAGNLAVCLRLYGAGRSDRA